MGGLTYDIDKELYKLAKGSVSIGDINMMWDFTEGLSEEEWTRKRKIEHQDKSSVFVLKSGRVIMPELGIY